MFEGGFMKRSTLIGFAAACETFAGAMSFSRHIVHGQFTPAAPIYNPYPPGILPSNLNSELARVLAEVDFVEARAVERWKALTPPILTNQPPILANTGTEAIETLGELMNYDKNISPNRNVACSSC